MARITPDMLRKAGACDDIDLFVELFPDGVEVTEELCLAHSQYFDWDWASCMLLSDDAAVDAYELEIAPAIDEYIRSIKSSTDRYGRGGRNHFSYVQECELAASEYNATCAVAFAHAFNNM